MKWKIRPAIAMILLMAISLVGCEMQTAIGNADTSKTTQVDEGWQVVKAVMPEAPRNHVSIFDAPEAEAPDRDLPDLVLGEEGDVPPPPPSDEDNLQEINSVKAYMFTIKSCGACKTQENIYFPEWTKTGWRTGTDPNAGNHVTIIKEGENLDIWNKYHISGSTHTMPYWLITVDGVPVDQFSGTRQHAAEISHYWKPNQQKVSQSEQVFKGLTNIDIPGTKKPYQSALSMLTNMIGRKYQINDKVAITSPKQINVRLTKVGNDVLLEFLGERPKVSAMGGWISPKLSAIRAKENKAVAELAGFPDFTFEFTD